MADRARWTISGDGLRYARELGVGTPVQGDIRSLPFGDGAFDLVMSVDVHRAPAARRRDTGGAANSRGCSRRGGLMVVRTSALDILRSRHAEFADERQRFTRAAPDGAVRRRRRTVAALHICQLAVAAGCAAKFRLWEPLLRKPPESGVQPVAPWLDRLLYAPLALEAAWHRRGTNFPAGQSLLLIGEKML